MDLGINGKTALVMGASRGIGRGIAAALAREGVRVAMASRSRERVAEAAKEIEGETAAFEAHTSDSIGSRRSRGRWRRSWGQSRSW